MSPMTSPKVIVPVILVLVIIPGVGGYFAGYYADVSARPLEYKPPEKIRATWIHVGPVGDMGWSYMHDIGRGFVQELFKEWLEKTYVEAVPEPKLLEVIGGLVAKGYNVIFTTS